MTQHLLDSKIKLSTCRRCSAYVFACDVSGLRVMADPGPIGLEAVRGALMASVDVYRLHSVAGRPDHLQLATAAQLAVQGAEWLQAHNCGTKAINSKRVEPVEVAPPPSPCALLSRKRGVAPDSCPRRNLAPDDVTGPVSCTLCDAVPFDQPRAEFVFQACETCGEMVGMSRDYVGVEYGGKWMWIMHAYDCREAE